jgi:hypothetical protein
MRSGRLVGEEQYAPIPSWSQRRIGVVDNIDDEVAVGARRSERGCVQILIYVLIQSTF